MTEILELAVVEETEREEGFEKFLFFVSYWKGVGIIFGGITIIGW